MRLEICADEYDVLQRLSHIDRSSFDRYLVCTMYVQKKFFKEPLFDKKWKFCIGHSSGKDNTGDACQQSELYRLVVFTRDNTIRD